jgi:hypothetical protein
VGAGFSVRLRVNTSELHEPTHWTDSCGSGSTLARDRGAQSRRWMETSERPFAHHRRRDAGGRCVELVCRPWFVNQDSCQPPSQRIKRKAPIRS